MLRKYIKVKVQYIKKDWIVEFKGEKKIFFCTVRESHFFDKYGTLLKIFPFILQVCILHSQNFNVLLIVFYFSENYCILPLGKRVSDSTPTFLHLQNYPNMSLSPLRDMSEGPRGSILEFNGFEKKQKKKKKQKATCREATLATCS